ncbi:hypothetical protein D3C80_1332770 [compost metagenome]
MLCWRGHETNTLDPGFLPPVQLLHLGCWHPPIDQQVTKPQRRDEVLGTVGQLPDGVLIEVIIVVMGKDHCCQRRQFIERERRLVESLRPGPLHRRGALGKHRVGDKKTFAQLEQYRGMPEPPHTAIRGFEQLLAAQGLYGNLHIRAGIRRLAEEQKLETDAQLFERTVLGQLTQVVVAPILALRRFTSVRGQRGHEQKHSKDEGKFHGTPRWMHQL